MFSVMCPQPPTRVRDVSHMLKAIHAQERRVSADEKAKAVIAELRLLRMGNAADLVEQSVHETLTYYAFPDIHWHKIRTNNPLERIMREIRRRTRVVGAFPDGQSCLNLAAARLRHIAGTQWSTKRYMNMRPLLQTEETLTEAAIARKNVRKNLDTTKRIWKIRCFITVVWETRFQGG